MYFFPLILVFLSCKQTFYLSFSTCRLQKYQFPYKRKERKTHSRSKLTQNRCCTTGPEEHAVKVTGESWETIKMQFPDLKIEKPISAMPGHESPRSAFWFIWETPLPIWLKMSRFTPRANLTQKPRHTRRRAWLPHSGLPCLYTVQPSNQAFPWSIFAAGWEALAEAVQGSTVEWGSQMGLVPN